MEIERLFTKESWLKYNKFGDKLKGENNEVQITRTQCSSRRREQKQQQNSAIIQNTINKR